MSRILILMGSDSDWLVMKKAAETLLSFGVPFEAHVSSTHRSPDRTSSLVKSFSGDCIIVGAGAAAHLGGIVASYTVKPVIAVPINASALNGLDALLATAQMPSGVPVATMAVDGAKNAALFAISILALTDASLQGQLAAYRRSLTEDVEKKDLSLQEHLPERK